MLTLLRVESGRKAASGGKPELQGYTPVAIQRTLDFSGRSHANPNKPSTFTKISNLKAEETAQK